MKDYLQKWIENRDPFNEKKIYLWGAGSTAEDFFIAYPNFIFYAFIDQNKKYNYLHKKIILSPDILLPDESLIIITSEFVEEIREKALKIGFCEDDIIDFFSLSVNQATSIIVSYYKCGKTWLRMMIGKVFQLYESIDEVDILNITKSKFYHYDQYHKMPNVVFHHEDFAHRKQKHELTRDKIFFEDKRVVFLYRDPRDVVVSNYYHMTYRARINQLSINDFVIFFFPGIIEYYNIWAKAKISNILYLKYEKLKKNPFKFLRDVLNFIDYNYSSNIDDQILHQAINYCNFDNMKKYEIQNKFNSQTLSLLTGDPRGALVRSGKSGGYKSVLDKELINYCNSEMQALSPMFVFEK